MTQNKFKKNNFTYQEINIKTPITKKYFNKIKINNLKLPRNLKNKSLISIIEKEEYPVITITTKKELDNQDKKLNQSISKYCNNTKTLYIKREHIKYLKKENNTSNYETLTIQVFPEAIAISQTNNFEKSLYTRGTRFEELLNEEL